MSSLEKSKRTWLRIMIYLKGGGVCSGYINCPYYRLLDVINNTLPMTTQDSNEEYLRIKEVNIYCLKRRETAEVASINKDDISFIRPIDHTGIPLIEKQLRRIRLYLPSYTLTGLEQYHMIRYRRNSLGLVPRFSPVTDVEISSQISGVKHGSPYVAVNREHVSLVEEVTHI
ncbi:MAG: hypothetical protein PHI12_06180 [Dehalococcoidales bacterium]|nr:hypothetical protein [Dehalococcoidales bacterium]